MHCMHGLSLGFSNEFRYYSRGFPNILKYWKRDSIFDLVYTVHFSLTNRAVYAGLFTRGGSKAYMPKKGPNIQRIINNDILKIVNIDFYGGSCSPPCVRPCSQTVLCVVVNEIVLSASVHGMPFQCKNKLMHWFADSKACIDLYLLSW
jgi:hypothetical protein